MCRQNVCFPDTLLTRGRIYPLRMLISDQRCVLYFISSTPVEKLHARKLFEHLTYYINVDTILTKYISRGECNCIFLVQLPQSHSCQLSWITLLTLYLQVHASLGPMCVYCLCDYLNGVYNRTARDEFFDSVILWMISSLFHQVDNSQFMSSVIYCRCCLNIEHPNLRHFLFQDVFWH